MKNICFLLILSFLCVSGCVQVTKDGKPINSNNESVAVDNELSKVLNSYKGEYAELKSEKTAEIVQEIMNGNISIDSVFAACNDAEQALNEGEALYPEG